MQDVTVKQGAMKGEKWSNNTHPLPIWELHDLPVPDISLFNKRTDILLDGQERFVKDLNDPHRYVCVPNEETLLEFNKQHSIFAQSISQCLHEIQKKNKDTYTIAELPRKIDLSILANNIDNISKGIKYIGDQAGCGMGWHLDNRLATGAMIINLQDNVDSTEFALSDEADEALYRGPTKRGTGIFWFNTYATFHRIIVTAYRCISFMNIGVLSVYAP